ncbi:MAG TPA: hypothetical protein VE131_09230 [Terriglobales bacterium]|nr:hypothetical protein [Terriglobales bacterium]
MKFIVMLRGSRQDAGRNANWGTDDPMIPNKEDYRALAEAQFKAREQQKADAPLSIKEYYAAQEAEREKTRRLRALRLSKASRVLSQTERPKNSAR